MLKVAIIGGAPSRHFAPFDDKSWAKWVLGNQIQDYDLSKVDKIFEVHENLCEHDSGYFDYLLSLGKPIIASQKLLDEHAGAELLTAFDYSSALELIGENFSSSPAVMMAQAIMDGAGEIGIWGVDMALDEHEYYMQRPSMEQWIGYAKGRGIKVFIHDSSSLGYTDYREGRDWPDKGFSGFDSGYYNDMASEHAARCSELEVELSGLLRSKQRLDELTALYQSHDGARQVYERLAKVDRAKKAGLGIDERRVGVKD